MATVAETTLRKILSNARIKPFQVSYYCERRDPEFDEFPETHGISEFSRIAVILRFLASFTDYPGDIVIGDFRFSSTAVVIM